MNAFWVVDNGDTNNQNTNINCEHHRWLVENWFKGHIYLSKASWASGYIGLYLPLWGSWIISSYMEACLGLYIWGRWKDLSVMCVKDDFMIALLVLCRLTFQGIELCGLWWKSIFGIEGYLQYVIKLLKSKKWHCRIEMMLAWIRELNMVLVAFKKIQRTWFGGFGTIFKKVTPFDLLLEVLFTFIVRSVVRTVSEKVELC